MCMCVHIESLEVYKYMREGEYFLAICELPFYFYHNILWRAVLDFDGSTQYGALCFWV